MSSFTGHAYRRTVCDPAWVVHTVWYHSRVGCGKYTYYAVTSRHVTPYLVHKKSLAMVRLRSDLIVLPGFWPMVLYEYSCATVGM